MPITVEQINEAFGYPLFTDVQHRFMTETLRHHVLSPWFHAIKTDKTKGLIKALEHFYIKVFFQGSLFYFTLEDVQSSLEKGVWLESSEDSPKVYGEEALVLLAERCKKQIDEVYVDYHANQRMTQDDTATLLKVVQVASRGDAGLCEAFGLPHIDKGWGEIPGIVNSQIEFLQKLESEKA